MGARGAGDAPRVASTVLSRWISHRAVAGLGSGCVESRQVAGLQSARRFVPVTHGVAEAVTVCVRTGLCRPPGPVGTPHPRIQAHVPSLLLAGDRD